MARITRSGARDRLGALRACFCRGVDLADTASLNRLARQFGLADGEAETAWSDARWKERRRRASDEAIAAGVFGAPFLIVDGEPFRGNDRRPQIERWLGSGPF